MTLLKDFALTPAHGAVDSLTGAVYLHPRTSHGLSRSYVIGSHEMRQTQTGLPDAMHRVRGPVLSRRRLLAQTTGLTAARIVPSSALGGPAGPGYHRVND